MSRLRQRLKKLETCRSGTDDIAFIRTGVPRHDRVVDLAAAMTAQGWITKIPYETDEEFKARVQQGQSCGC